jgi:hypothetical protein
LSSFGWGVLTVAAHDEVLQGSRQKSRLLTAATKLLSEKSAAGDFFPMY